MPSIEAGPIGSPPPPHPITPPPAKMPAKIPAPTRRALARHGFADWEAFASLDDAAVAALPLTGRDIDALGLDADEAGGSLLRGADGLLASWRMPAREPDPPGDALPDAEAE